MPVPTRRYGLLSKRLEQFTRTLQGLEHGEVRALHRTRIASRRLRELLPILRLDSDVARKLSRRLRNVTKRLGAVRELDVLLLLIDELRESGRHSEGSLKRLAAAVAGEQPKARERLVAKLPTAELHRLAAKLDKIAGGLKASERSSGRGTRSSRWAVEARLTHRASGLRTAMHDAGAVYLPERLHTVRLAVKKLRYAVELSADLSGLRTTPELRALKHTQDVLGRLHDAQIVIDRVRELQASLAPPDVAAWRELDALMTSLENNCRRLHAGYMHERSELLAICDRVGVRPAAPAVRHRAG